MPEQPWTVLTALSMRTSGLLEQMAIHCPFGEEVAMPKTLGDISLSEGVAPTALMNLLGNSTAVVCGSPRSI